MDLDAKKIIRIIILIIIIVAAVAFYRDRAGVRRSVAGIRAPIQEEAKGVTKTTVKGWNVRIEYQYSYDIEALVVHTKRYSGSGLGDQLAPVDAALAWGDVAKYNDSIDFHWGQARRWYTWKVNSYEELAPVGAEYEVGIQSSNNHLIPSTRELEKQVKKLRTGDHVRIKGYLVNIDGTKSDGSTFWWNSSTTREDTGDGACEVFYVTELQWLD